MNNSNPFVPQGSLLDQKNKKRARVKIAIYSIFALNILLITPLLIQGCKREQPADTTGLPPAPDTTTNVDTNTAPPALPAPSNSVPTNVSANTSPQQQPIPAPQPVPQVDQTPAPTAQEYVVAKGDSFYSIAKKFSLKIKEVEAANPGVNPSKLKVGQKLQIPPAGASSAVSANPSMSSAEGAEESYTVKTGDSLTRIAKHYGVSVRSIRSANSLKSDHIKVGEKLKIPAKTAPAEAPVPTQSTPAPAPASAPASTTPNQ